VTVPGGEIVEKLLVMVAAGSAPDTVQMMHSLFPAFARGGAVKPLTPFFNRDRSVSPKDFDPGQNACYTWKNELYGLGGGIVPLAAIYANKRLFDAAGVRIPTAQESANLTWERIVELAQKLTRPDGDQYGLLVEDFNVVPFSGGAYWVNDRMNPTRGAMDDPRWIRAIELWVDWTTRKHVMPTAADRTRLGETGWPQMFAHGKLAMYLGGPWQIETFLREEPQLPWEMFWAPRLAADQPRRFASGGTGWGITPNARNQELSWEFLKFIDRKPGSYEIELETNAPLAVYLSSYLPVNEQEIARLQKLGMANVDILVKGAAEVQWWPFHPDWPRVMSDVLNPELSKMQRGEVAPAGALRELNERITRQLQTT
jgi:ABC-type glycerol-3-phosphate transport system substrate-binding protein